MKNFDNEKYLELQKKDVIQRMKNFERLYIEIGGKIFDDSHAKRVLIDFDEDNKIKTLEVLKKDIEVAISISNQDIENEKIRKDKNITYEDELFQLIKKFQEREMLVSAVIINKYSESYKIKNFIEKVNQKYPKIKICKIWKIENYPYDPNIAVSDEGFGKSDFFKAKKKIVLVTGPGAGSGKMTFCLSQIYHEFKANKKCGYAKIETFPIADLGTLHPVNLAYEAATVDIKDKVLVDPFYLEKYGKLKSSYNRDIELFPILKNMLNKIFGFDLYTSPTEMGINHIAECINNEENIIKAANEEIIRRYFNILYVTKHEFKDNQSLNTINEVLNKANLTPEDSEIVKSVREIKDKENREVIAIKIENENKIIFGKKTKELFPTASVILNTLKYKAKMADELLLIPKDVLLPVLELKRRYLNNENALLDAWDVLIILSILKSSDKNIVKMIKNMDILKNARMHSSYDTSSSDKKLFNDLNIDITYEA